MLALVENEIEDTAKQLAATLKNMADVLTTDEMKALTIAQSLDGMPDITAAEKRDVIGRLPKYGVSQAVADLALTKLGKPLPKPKTLGWWVQPWWVYVLGAVALTAAVGGTVYFVRRKA